MSLKKGALTVVAASVGIMGGCKTVTYDMDEAPLYTVLRDRTPFYSVGPLQIGGPDELLPAMEVVKLLRKEWGYSVVQLANGRAGYVPNELIIPSANAHFPGDQVDEVQIEEVKKKPRVRKEPVYSGPPVEPPLPDFNSSEPVVDLDEGMLDDGSKVSE